jgi:hypothetical protein
MLAGKGVFHGELLVNGSPMEPGDAGAVDVGVGLGLGVGLGDGEGLGTGLP